ncbi:hypothetical protein DQ04_00411120 [Trypanosoma grayi]|uniref:hypothetical protein n=1 Tax=Trypanosoma grayi TaxID=71804 RepID=UPI0004F467B4|nr:hypothetical protein DQ04_00411120 [Trypanosoma grayi]KEG14548.1 hypothetical protein DQ04_00411120 [Trypanosoma grayi]
MMRRLISGDKSLSRCFGVLPGGDRAAFCFARFVATYPSPSSNRGVSKSGRKKYNFLTSTRLVETAREPRSRRDIRLRDDVFFHRRTQFRESVNSNIAKYIRYFPENVKRYVFYKNKPVNVVNASFLGMRKVPGCVLRRILQLTEDEILKPKNREHLIELIESTGTTPPTKEEWARYTDKKTGEININLYYHSNLDKPMRIFCLLLNSPPPFREFQAFMLLNRNNFDICPPMRTWSLRQGPLRDEELVERGSQKEVRDMVGELADYQRPHVMRAFKNLTLEERKTVLEKAEANRKELRHEYERERLFGAKLMCGVTALKEVRALTSPAITYYNQEYYKYIIRLGGSVEATLRRSKDEIPRWYTLPKEARLKYYCFERAVEMHPVGGAHLYLRYCCRDYGLSREDSMERWSGLSDLQKAALNFCFYAPISAPRRSTSAFRRFYVSQCYRHGLVMTGKACSNRAFFARVKKIWMRMNADERAQFEDTESFSSVFPLHSPSSTAPSGRNALDTSCAETATAATVSAEGDTVQSDNDCSGEAEDDFFYFEDEAIEDDPNQHSAQRCEAHGMLHPQKEEHAIFTI